MLKRLLTEKIEQQLTQAPAIALLGPRQVGKTTLAKYIGRQHNALYLDLESPENLLKLNDPVNFLGSHSKNLIIIDEIQRAPELFMALRGIIDQNRENGKVNGQFLLLGSASMDLMLQSSESLAGRITYTGMHGLNILETEQTKQSIQKLWVTGGFPNSYLAQNDKVSMDWLEDLIRTYLERDIPQMGFQVPASRLRRLWTMLAHLQGEPLNTSKLASNLEVQRSAINRYIDILQDLLLIRRLPAWHSNVKKRLTKSPRYYIRDSGIQHRLLGIHSHESLISNPILGKSWEGFVIENIHSVLPKRAQTYFYHTAAGAEIDLVIKFSSSQTWAVEIKHGTAPKIHSHYSKTCDDVEATEKYVVYGGNDEFTIKNNVTVLSLQKLMQKIQALK